MTDRRTNPFFDGRRAFFRAAAVGLAAGALAACGTILPEPPQLYTLTPKSTFPPDLPTVDWTLLVEEPVAPAGLDTVRIPLSRTPTTVDYYASVAWVDRAPAMVQRLMLESFENSGRIVGVSRNVVGLRGDYMLKADLREFQVEQWAPNAPPRVRVRINVNLVEMPDREIVAGETFQEVLVSETSNFADIVEAFDTALGNVLKDIVAWTLVTGERHEG